MIEDDFLKLSDEELVKKTLENGDFFAYIVSRYEDKLERYIFRLSNSTKEDIEDILQDVFIKVYRNLNDFDEDLKFSSWIYRITHNEVISNFRKINSRPKKIEIDGDLDFIENLASDLDIEFDIDNNLLREKLLECIQNLDIKYREPVALKFLEDKDYLEISDILKKPMGTVATLINRGKERLKEEFKKNNFKI